MNITKNMEENPNCPICCDNIYKRIMICNNCMEWICRNCYLNNNNSQRDLQYQWGDFDSLKKPITCVYCRHNYDRPLRGYISENKPYILTKRLTDLTELNNMELNNNSLSLDIFKESVKTNSLLNDFFKNARIEDLSVLF
jgi:hypothetical protein